MTHELKIWPQYYEAVLDGTKTFEIRENDRGFQKGDALKLHEWDPMIVEREEEYPLGTENVKSVRGYTGRFLHFKIGYVLPIDDKRVVFSLLQKDADVS